MKEYSIKKELTKELTLPLLSYIGKHLTEEYSKGISKIEDKQGYKSIKFQYKDDYERFEEETIEKFMEECQIKNGCAIDFTHSYDGKHFTLSIEYGTPLMTMKKIFPPKAWFWMNARGEDQIWCEGIANKYFRLIDQLDVTQIIEKLDTPTEKKPVDTPTEKKPVDTPTKESDVTSKSNKGSSFLKNHLPQVIIGIATSVIGGIIVILYFSK